VVDRILGHTVLADYYSAKPFRIGVADADDFELAVERLRDHHAHAAGADVQTYDGRVLSCHCLTSSGVRFQVSGFRFQVSDVSEGSPARVLHRHLTPDT